MYRQQAHDEFARKKTRVGASMPNTPIAAARQAVMVSPVPAELLGSADELATLPQVARSVSALAGNPHSDAQAIIRVAGWDPALTARLLARANDPRWGQSGLVDCASRAITVIDLATLRRLPERIPESPAWEPSWNFSVHAAAAARAIALRSGKGRPSVVFTAGLLLEAGRLVLPSAWRLPGCLRACVTFHRDPQKARGFRTEVAIAHLAGVLAALALTGSEDLRSAPAVDGEAWLRAGLTPAEGLALLGPVHEQALAARQLFED
jgi:HD-like signal output (HDOD) protein